MLMWVPRGLGIEGQNELVLIFLRNSPHYNVHLGWFPIVLRLHALRGQKLSNLCTFEGKSLFQYFVMSTWAYKAKLTANFLAFTLVEFHNIWKTGSKYDFTIVGAHLSGKSIRAVFSVVKDKFAEIEKTAITNHTFLCLKFISHRMRCTVPFDFTRGNARKSQMVLCITGTYVLHAFNLTPSFSCCNLYWS